MPFSGKAPKFTAIFVRGPASSNVTFAGFVLRQLFLVSKAVRGVEPLVTRIRPSRVCMCLLPFLSVSFELRIVGILTVHAINDTVYSVLVIGCVDT